MKDTRVPPEGPQRVAWVGRTIDVMLNHPVEVELVDSASGDQILFESGPASSGHKPGTTTMFGGAHRVELGPADKPLRAMQLMAMIGEGVVDAWDRKARVISLTVPDVMLASGDLAFVGMAVNSALLDAGTYKTSDTRYTGPMRVEIVDGQRLGDRGVLEKGLELSRAANVARWLTAQPRSVLTVDTFAEVVIETFTGLEGCTVLEPTSDQYARMGLINGVAAASEIPPRVVAVRIDPLSGPTDNVCAYVGKGLVYDSGGYCLKPKGGRGMKGDKGGAGSVFGAAVHASRHRDQLTQSVVYVFAITINMIGPKGALPDDVFWCYSGHSVEMDNTDAEGRLALADAGAWICDELKLGKGDQVCFVATLTGAAVVALGKAASALHLKGSLDRLDEVGALEQLGIESGDHVNVLHDEIDAALLLASDIADIKNSSGGKSDRGSSQGFAFLCHFMPKDVDVMELDIAGKSGDFSKTHGFQKGTALPAGTWFMAAREASRAS